jgi:tRNASer (uridine44-2'-O)-methyltransferase
MAATIPVRDSAAFNPSPIISACPLAFPTPLLPLWKPVLETPCAFAPSHFLQAAENMLRNPNLTSTCLYRAEIYYDSDQDATSFADLPALGGGGGANPTANGGRGLVAHLRRDVQPRGFECVPPGWSLNRAVVRNLVPRNPSLDPFLVQTVLFARRRTDRRDESLVIHVPHVDKEDDVPFYHPRVSAAVLLHSCPSAGPDDPAPASAARPPGTLSVLYRLFAPAMSEDLPARLQRTALNLLRITHKHSTGRATGYQKRVHHDAVIPQARFQDTYSRLKARYARILMDAWAEVTDPAKHVFEDLGIAAFLIELWRDMYGDGAASGGRWRLGRGMARLKKPGGGGKTRFPGFVDIGCGNGVLVFLLLSEGYDGRGFDARKRKSWSVFPESVQERLQEMQLVPEILARHAEDEVKALRADSKLRREGGIHNGLFPEGTFIISNHADQLTPWTPLIAYMSNCPFIAIPCCSHSLSGKVQRFYDMPPSSQSSASTSSTDTVDRASSSTEETGSELPPKKTSDTAGSLSPETESVTPPTPPRSSGPGPATGVLAPRPKNQPSAYAGFTAHVMRLAERVGYAVESEHLRIPSTRNLCVIGRGFSDADGASSFGKKRRDKDGDSDRDESEDDRLQAVEELVEEEVGDLDGAARDWVKAVIGLTSAGVGRH